MPGFVLVVLCLLWLVAVSMWFLYQDDKES